MRSIGYWKTDSILEGGRVEVVRCSSLVAAPLFQIWGQSIRVFVTVPFASIPHHNQSSNPGCSSRYVYIPVISLTSTATTGIHATVISHSIINRGLAALAISGEAWNIHKILEAHDRDAGLKIPLAKVWRSPLSTHPCSFKEKWKLKGPEDDA